MAARRGRARVALVEMKPCAMSPAHQTPAARRAGVLQLAAHATTRSRRPACSSTSCARCGSLVIACADQHRVPAGQALAVERFGFARAITQRLALHPRIRIERRRLDELPDGAGDRRDRPAHRGRARRGDPRASSAAIACTSTTRSRRSSRPTRSTGTSRSARRAGAATATPADAIPTAIARRVATPASATTSTAR